MYTISVLASGSGSTLENLATHCSDNFIGMLHGFVTIKRVVVDRDCGAIQVAKQHNLPFEVVRRKDYESAELWSQALLKDDVDLHVMGGFLSRVIVRPELEGKIVNIHPSLLPAYGGEGMYGMNVHRAVIEANEAVSGCTIHTVDNEYDKGMIIGQHKIGILQNDTAESLREAVQNLERMLYPRSILNYLKWRRIHRVGG